MDLDPQILTAKVMHQRLFPKKNSFTYGVYYLVLPLPAPSVKTRFLRFDPSDLGLKDGSDPEIFAKAILTKYGFEKNIHNIILVTMPRVFGYIFNPVSFYCCFANDQKLLAVIAEVHNTFGEQHTYFCAHPDHSIISSDQWLTAEKVFHVSPFLPRHGSYRFKFSLQTSNLSIWIDYFDKEQNKQLITSLTGKLEPLNAQSLRKAFWSHPLVTIKAIVLIHWQALKLLCKNIGYIPKPTQHKKKISATLNIQDVQKTSKSETIEFK